MRRLCWFEANWIRVKTHDFVQDDHQTTELLPACLLCCVSQHESHLSKQDLFYRGSLVDWMDKTLHKLYCQHESLNETKKSCIKYVQLYTKENDNSTYDSNFKIMLLTSKDKSKEEHVSHCLVLINVSPRVSLLVHLTQMCFNPFKPPGVILVTGGPGLCLLFGARDTGLTSCTRNRFILQVNKYTDSPDGVQ